MRETRRSIGSYVRAAAARERASGELQSSPLSRLSLILSVPFLDRELLSGHAYGLGRRRGGVRGHRFCGGKKKIDKCVSILADSFRKRFSTVSGGEGESSIFFFTFRSLFFFPELSASSSSQRVHVLHPQLISLFLSYPLSEAPEPSARGQNSKKNILSDLEREKRRRCRL